MKKTLVLTAAVVLSFGAIANASNPGTGGTLALTGEVDGSIALQIKTSDSGPITLASGANTAAATASIAAVSYYGTADNSSVSGFVKSHDSSNIILTGNFDVQVDKANITSTDYTLTAKMSSATDGLSWSLGGQTLGGSDATVSSTDSYATPVTHALVIKVPTSSGASTTLINNTIDLTATAN